MAKITLIIQSSAEDQPKSLEALSFARAAIKSGHEIPCVFFYRNAVNHALQPTPDQNRDLITQWEALSHQYQVPLVVCHTVAERKGIESFQPSFEPSGLTALATAIANSERTLQF
ncbi:sulfurtransferase complex subunit TusD [Idiomarina aminovorans]|uniref:sulfurtransferase complex subunit TusD n=1 Tax=Idiomarina aminovorans TaxID=2914829 RepID=UPI00200528BD|nr:sulfurtransferase complex subunit TusD [Idiomarina sp. ATCH4]MCK7458645.1 sulfurtransferase complex subunit TusD [Idiomarina sp. ATCH4]